MALWDLVQQMQLRGLRAAAASDREYALLRERMQDERVDSVESKVEELREMVEALWEVLVAKLGVEEADLVDALELIEERKAELNRVVPCAECGAAMKRSDHHCQFCGAKPPEPPPTNRSALDRVEF